MGLIPLIPAKAGSHHMVALIYAQLRGVGDLRRPEMAFKEQEDRASGSVP